MKNLSLVLFTALCSATLAPAAIIGTGSPDPTLYSIDELTGSRQPVVRGIVPFRLVSHTGDAFAGIPGAGGPVLFADAATGAFQRELPLPAFGVVTGLAYGASQFGPTLFVTHNGNRGAIELVDPVSGALLGSFNTGLNGLGEIEFDPFAGELVGVSISRELIFIDAVTGQTTGLFPTNEPILSVAVSEPLPGIPRGTMFGLHASLGIVELDPFSGSILRVVGSSAGIQNITGFAPIPEPSAGMLALFGASLAIRRRRR
jgi:hypothetical protein